MPRGGLDARAEEREARRAEKFRFRRKGSGAKTRRGGGGKNINQTRSIIYIHNFYSYMVYMHVSQVCSMYLYIRTGHFMQPGLALTFATILYLYTQHK